MDPCTHLVSSGTFHPIFKQLSLSCLNLFILAWRSSLWLLFDQSICFYKFVTLCYKMWSQRHMRKPWYLDAATFDVHKSVHHHMIQIDQPTRCNSFISLLLDVYVWLNMFWASLCPSSGAYNCTKSLWFYCWIMAVGALLVMVWQVILPDHDQCPLHIVLSPSSTWIRFGNSFMI
jgi:hypothetical protein